MRNIEECYRIKSLGIFSLNSESREIIKIVFRHTPPFLPSLVAYDTDGRSQTPVVNCLRRRRRLSSVHFGQRLYVGFFGGLWFECFLSKITFLSAGVRVRVTVNPNPNPALGGGKVRVRVQQVGVMRSAFFGILPHISA